MADQTSVETEGTEEMEASSAEDEVGEEESLQKAKQAITCRSVTLNTLMDDGVIQPGEGVLSIDYLGQRFEADLLETGKIKWHGSEDEFNTPSAWALHCKRLVNPIKRSGCGWASVKYKNKKLDMWKSIWARKHRTSSPFKSPLQNSTAVSPTNSSTPISSPTAITSTSPKQTTCAQATTQSDCNTTVMSVTNATTTASTMDTSTTNTLAPDNPPGGTVAPLPVQLPSVSLSSSLSPLVSCLATKPTATRQEPENETTAKPVGNEPATKEPDLGTQMLLSMLGKKDLEFLEKGGISDVSPRKATGTEVPTTPTTTTPLNLSKPPLLVSAMLEEPPTMVSKSTPPKEVPRSCHDVVLKEKKSVPYASLGIRAVDMDMNTLVKCEQFDMHSRIQPFTVSVTSNSLLLMDFHCHLTRSEVVGYLGGKWDPQKQHLSVEQSFPVLCRLGDKQRAPLVQEQVRQNMRRRQMTLVGWYHSHPYCQAEPSVRDIDCQMTYQLKMRGSGALYNPCIGFIEAPYDKLDHSVDPSVTSFWVMPNLDHPSAYNIPMNVSYTTQRDHSLTEDILHDMKRISEFYSGSPDKVRLKERWKESMTYMDKIRISISKKLPEDQLDSGTFLDYMQQLLKDMK